MLEKKNIWFLCPIVLIIISLILYPRLPEDIPMQFNIHGEANWTLPKMIGLWIMPCLQIVLLLWNRNKENNNAGLVVVLLMFIQLCVMITSLGGI